MRLTDKKTASWKNTQTEKGSEKRCYKIIQLSCNLNKDGYVNTTLSDENQPEFNII